MIDRVNVRRALLAEFIGTAGLLCAVIGSGIMAERLSGGNNGVALLANTLVTVFALYVLIETLGPASGAHFNPVVTLIMWSKGRFAHVSIQYFAIYYIALQLLGAVAGAWAANLMFDLPILQFSSKLRGGFDAAGQFTSWGQWVAEGIATAGLIFVILRSPPGKASLLVACYIGAAYWFTASTSFANPAAVLGRMMSDSFAGIAPASALGFVLAQAVGGGAGVMLARWLEPLPPEKLHLEQTLMTNITLPHNLEGGIAGNTPPPDMTDLPNVTEALFTVPSLARLMPAVPAAHPPRILLLYGSLRERSFSRLLSEEAARLLVAMGCETRTFNPEGLPLADSAPDTHPKVQELRDLAAWSEGMVWSSPERHGAMTGIMKTQIDWVPLSLGAVRPTQGKTLAVMQVSGGSQSFNAVNQLRVLGRWMRMITIPNQSSVAKAFMEFDDAGRMKPSAYYDRVVDVMEELVKFTLLTRDVSPYLVDRYSERKESAEALSRRVNQRAI